jgi:hypothetical protein
MSAHGPLGVEAAEQRAVLHRARAVDLNDVGLAFVDQPSQVLDHVRLSARESLEEMGLLRSQLHIPALDGQGRTAREWIEVRRAGVVALATELIAELEGENLRAPPLPGLHEL